jgi:hypothetical protein
LPGYFYLPEVSSGEANELGLEGSWPASSVVIASTTLVSRGIVAPNRIMSLGASAVTDLQSAVVRFTSVRGWGDIAAAEPLLGMQVVDIQETMETVPGPSRLAKVMLDSPDGGDEITVVWGLRPSRRRSG